MAALFSKFGKWLLKYLITFIFKFLKDQIIEELKRRHDSEEQEKKDEELKKTYDQAVQNGSSKEIESSTEDRLNG
jgi:hypothetical protein